MRAKSVGDGADHAIRQENLAEARNLVNPRHQVLGPCPMLADHALPGIRNQVHQHQRDGEQVIDLARKRNEVGNDIYRAGHIDQNGADQDLVRAADASVAQKTVQEQD